MKIKLAILEKDQSYLNRIVTAFSTKYADKFEIYSFTEPEIALQTLKDIKIDVFVANDTFDIDLSKLPLRCGFAYFVDSAGIDMLNDRRAICKYQKADLIYKQILSIYSENAENIIGLKISDDECKIITFASPSCGTGCSSLAAACAIYYARQNKKTLYLNLEKFSSQDIFFSAEGQFGMSDVIFALKSKKANLSMKLESCVKQDKTGVYFYSQSKTALDMLEMTYDDMMRLISELKLTGSYDYIIIDKDFSLDNDSVKIYKQTHALVWSGDGSEISNAKISRAYEAISIREQHEDVALTNRICLIYNKFSNKTGKAVGDIGIKNIGGAPVYVHASTKQVVDQLAQMDVFSKII